jgi:hypothetical protein
LVPESIKARRGGGGAILAEPQRLYFARLIDMLVATAKVAAGHVRLIVAARAKPKLVIRRQVV